MPVFTREGRSVLFAHIPKTGGTSLERLFRRAGWETEFRATKRSHPGVFPVLRCSPQHYHAALLRELVAVERVAVSFAVVREPLARFRSEYVMRNTVDSKTDAASVERWSRQALARYADDPFVYDNHLRPQHEFLLPGVTTYRLEDGLEAVVADLNSRYGLDLDTRIPHSSHSKRRMAPPSSAVEVSPAVLEMVTDFYRDDYQQLDYPLPQG